MEVPSSEQGGHALASSGNGPLALNLTTSISVSRLSYDPSSTVSPHTIFLSVAHFTPYLPLLHITPYCILPHTAYLPMPHITPYHISPLPSYHPLTYNNITHTYSTSHSPLTLLLNVFTIFDMIRLVHFRSSLYIQNCCSSLPLTLLFISKLSSTIFLNV